MADHILKISDDFWNIRGSFKLGGLLDIGTHSSLIRMSNGKYVLLDAYTLSGRVKEEIDEVTKQGKDLEAIINLHPFHTVHVKKSHDQFPGARLYGTKRHQEKFPDLPWESVLSESEKCAEIFKSDIAFSVPAGVDFISKNENLHFSSVLAYHKASKTIHSDDTLMYFRLPGPLGFIKKPEVSFHLTLSKTLERRAGAAKDFRKWAKTLAEQWRDAENLCAAHSYTLLATKNTGKTISERILDALNRVEKTLRHHDQKFE